MMKRFIFGLLISVLLIVGCTPSPTATVVPQTATLVSATVTATVAPPTETPILPTATPDYSDFAKFTPEAATINEAVFKGVNFKFALLENNNKIRSLADGKEFPSLYGNRTMQTIYFVADKADLQEKVISKSTYVMVTFSDGKEEITGEGRLAAKDFKIFKGRSASKAEDEHGQTFFIFDIPKEGMKIVKFAIAENSSQKDKAVVLYQK
jgi:hypothetical protein